MLRGTDLHMGRLSIQVIYSIHEAFKKLMSTDNSRSQIFLHSNGSSLSSLPLQKMPAQVSSVGFNTLKKQPTNSSVSSSTATINTVKSNSLARLFTRSRSSSTLNDKQDESRLSLDGLNSTNSEDLQKMSSLFKLSRKQTKFKLTNKGTTRPDLTIQTAGHHSLKLPKKLLSSSSVDDFGKKNNPSSMSLNSLFHRPHGQTKLETNQKSNQDDAMGVSKPLSSMSQKSSVTLSSQSSNSFVSDRNFAALFNFTESDFANNATDGNSDLPTIQEIHRKYMISADQFVQAKLHRNTADGPHSVSAETYDEDDLVLTPIEAEKKNFKVFSELFAMMYALFIPSTQITLRNGRSAPQLLITMEHAANFVRQRLVPNISKEKETKSLYSRNDGSRSTITLSLEADSSFPNNIDEEATEAEKKELVQELSEFFEKCITMMLTNYRQNRRRLTESKNTYESLNRPRTQNSMPRGSKSKYDLILKEWDLISGLWQYFNTKVRFFVLNAFFPLQAHLDEEKVQQKTFEPIEILIENLLLKAFRDVVIIPHLNQRASEVAKALVPPDSSEELHPLHPIYDAEVSYFQQHTDCFKSLRKCLGTIRSHLRQTLMSPDDQLAGEPKFEEFVHWFNSIPR